MKLSWLAQSEQNVVAFTIKTVLHLTKKPVRLSIKGPGGHIYIEENSFYNYLDSLDGIEKVRRKHRAAITLGPEGFKSGG